MHSFEIKCYVWGTKQIWLHFSEVAVNYQLFLDDQLTVNLLHEVQVAVQVANVKWWLYNYTPPVKVADLIQ